MHVDGNDLAYSCVEFLTSYGLVDISHVDGNKKLSHLISTLSMIYSKCSKILSISCLPKRLRG